MSSDGNIMTGAITNGTVWVGSYDPNLPVPHWHQKMELATICVCNSLTRKQLPLAVSWHIVVQWADFLVVIVIISRLWYRWIKLKHFRGDDAWIAVAGVSTLVIRDQMTQDPNSCSSSWFHIGPARSGRMFMAVDYMLRTPQTINLECIGMYV
jgi:hypothetical protein